MGKFVERNPNAELGLDSRAMLAKANKDKKVIKFRDRVKLEILKDTRFYRKGQVINPHPLVGDELIEAKIAKKIK